MALAKKYFSRHALHGLDFAETGTPNKSRLNIYFIGHCYPVDFDATDSSTISSFYKALKTILNQIRASL